ncbi:MAG: ABC transporter ATP-binding protein [Deltaproteobacteria bacterium]|nr:ABC transporter ATP-binding protein [Deltaproteobacteria bacterium]
MLLNLNNVTVHYDVAEAVKNVTLEVIEGSVTSIIGANGAGKSTILKSISGLVRPSSGTIQFNGETINRLSIDKIVSLGIIHVLEGRGLFPYMSVLSNIKIGAYLRKDRDGIEKDLERVYELFPRLKERMNQKAESLSGGEQQMVAIGRALMAKPKLLMLDEPSLGLAPLIIESLAETIVNINKSGISVLLVEQNASLVTSVAQKAYVLEVGKIVMEGDIKELMDNETVRKAFLG